MRNFETFDLVGLWATSGDETLAALGAMCVDEGKLRNHVGHLCTAREDPNDVRFTVRDCGVGIDQEQTQKLFDAFYTTKTHGMGVGLSISRSIIESHSGRLWAIANDGPGATFLFSVPTIQ